MGGGFGISAAISLLCVGISIPSLLGPLHFAVPSSRYGKMTVLRCEVLPLK